MGLLAVLGAGVGSGAWVNSGAAAIAVLAHKNNDAAAAIFSARKLKVHFDVDMSVPPTDLPIYFARVCHELLHWKP